MPTLQFKGKNIIWNHHLSVPYHTLDEVEKLAYMPTKAGGNLIIEGDNLLALKALLPRYGGKVKCIYIDPPYNIGNEHWIYNDRVNSPMIKEWLGKEVAKDDLTRHDKWLCMMVPRLKLLRELLTDDGSVFVSIDHNEEHHLRAMLDEIFGEGNFVACVCWQKVFAKKNKAVVSQSHDTILVYTKQSKIWDRNLIPRTEDDISAFTKHDNDPRGPWQSVAYSVQSEDAEKRKNYRYPIKLPSGRSVNPPQGRHWNGLPERTEQLRREDRLWFGSKGDSPPRVKVFLSEVQEGIVPDTWWNHEDYGNNQEAKKELLELFPGQEPFSTPKPLKLVKRILQIASKKDSIILDSFAGSGTTMHAVMDLNKEDGGKRSCIMVQMTEASAAEPKKNVCKDVTRERVKRAIEKFHYDSGFQYQRVGIPIDAETLLSGQLPSYEQLAEYVYYLCTGVTLPAKSTINEKLYYVGGFDSGTICLVYTQNFEVLTTLAQNLELAERFLADHKGKKLIVYAPACFLEEDFMREKNIDFVGIPYNLFRRAGI
jgi:adenine-specific DNA-methyltransferase